MALPTAPATITAGTKPTAASFNTYRDNLNFLLAPPRCRAFQSASQNTTSGTETAITFTNEDIDTDGMHSNVTNTSRFTCVVPGRYRFVGGCGIAGNASGTRTIRLRKGGATTIIAIRQPGNASNTFLQITEDILLAAGEYIELTMQQDSAATLATTATSDTTYLHASWVGTV